MSSQPPKPTTPKPKWYSYWPKWRRIMITGAVVLLIGALIPAIQGDGSNRRGWLPNASLIMGYGFLAYGFFLAMRARSDAREAATRSPHGTGEESSDEAENRIQRR